VVPLRATRPSTSWSLRCCLLLAVCLGGCTDVGLGGPGTGTPLPAGGLPASQTLEGGAQIEISPAGIQEITSVATTFLTGGVGQGICVGPQSITTVSGTASFCNTNQGTCSPGCALSLAPTSVQFAATNAGVLNVHIDASASASVHIQETVFGIPASCTATVAIEHLVTDADVGLSIDPATGALGLQVTRIGSASSSGVTISNCSTVSDIATLLPQVLTSLGSTWVTDDVTPALNDLVAGFLPSQSELAALVDLPALALTGPAAGNGSRVETRIAPGGYVGLANGGLSLGVVTGFNSDADPSTRSPGLASEPDPCVPGLTAPDLSQPPYGLSTSTRGSFVLPPADAFLGTPMPGGDLMLGVSRSALDLAGHHLVASGGLCLTLDAGQLELARRDRLDDLLGIPLADTDADLRFLVRPQQGIQFAIGTGAAGSPHLSALLPGLQIEVDSVSAGSATPALLLTADVTLGLQIETRHDEGLPMRLEATRASLSVADPVVAVLDPRYAGVAAADLDAWAGTVADVVFGALGADAGTFLVSELGGIPVDDVSVTRVTTSSDDFLAFTGSLGGSPHPIDPPAPTPQPSSTTVVEPTPAELRASLLAGDDTGLPTVHVALPTSDGTRPLEHAWRLAGGPWHPYEATGDLVIRDRSFAWQGERTIELRSRVVGDDSTTSAVGSTTAVIDDAPPALLVDQKSFSTDLVVPARDAVSTTLEWAMGRVGEGAPATAWTTDPQLDRTTALALGNDIVVYVRDASGHVAQATVQLLDPALLPANDACAGASLLAGTQGEDVSFATGAATDPASTCGSGDRSVWFTFVPSASGTARISTSGSGYSTVVSVWPQAQGCGGPATQVACGIDGASVPVEAGVPLLVEVQRGTLQGTADLRIELTPEPDAGTAAVLVWVVLAVLAHRIRRRGPGRLAQVGVDPAPGAG
jgi:hypothetical protein